jgi:hypothetical protein
LLGAAGLDFGMNSNSRQVASYYFDNQQVFKVSERIGDGIVPRRVEPHISPFSRQGNLCIDGVGN